MKYNSIGEYFYKLSNRCLGLILLPVLLVLMVYLTLNYLPGASTISLKLSLSSIELLGIEVSAFLILITMKYHLTALKIKKLWLEPSLSKRMKGYILVVLIRGWMMSSMLLICGCLTFISGNLNLLYPLPIVGILFLIYWPTPLRMAADLKLKPEEKEIMQNKKLGT